MDKGKQPLVTGSANVFSEDVICLSEPVDKAKGLTVAESFGISQDLMSRFGTAAAQTESVSDHGNTKKTGAAYDQANQTRRKRSREGTPTTDGEGKTHTQGSQVSKEIAVSDKMMAVAPAAVAGQLVGPAVSSAMTTALELRNSSSVHTKTNPTSAPQPSVVLRLEAWLQVLDEIGVDVASQLSAAPKGRIASKNTENVGSSGVDDLEKRLAALRNP